MSFDGHMVNNPEGIPDCSYCGQPLSPGFHFCYAQGPQGQYYAERTPTEAQQRKATPVWSGVDGYFPDAVRGVARVSFAGNEQHHPGEPLHWDRNKSSDHRDALKRHWLDHDENPIDTDGEYHVDKAAWRALAFAQEFHERRKEAEDDHRSKE